MNPYELLQISQTATNQEINEAFLKQVYLFCGNDSNQKNEAGDYLLSQYLEARKQLLDCEKRKKIDQELQEKKKMLPSTKERFEEKKNWMITSINQSIFETEEKTTFSFPLWDKKVELEGKFFVIVETGNVMITYAKLFYHADRTYCELREFFSNQDIMGLSYDLGDHPATGKIMPWEKVVFRIGNYKEQAVAFPLYQVVPLKFIRNGKTKESVLRRICESMSNFYQKNPSSLQELFEAALQEQEEYEKRVRKEKVRD